MIESLFLEELKAKFPTEIIEGMATDSTCFDIVISSEKLLDAINILKTMNAFYLAAITGLDDGTEKNTLQVLYHFCNRVYVITLRVTLNRNEAIVPSICASLPYASPFERETGEMFGITFTDTPDTSRLFLSDDWVEGVYPLLKDAKLDEVNHDNTE